ncbi:LytTR family DNA-binding domain-containing protein [Ancylomarina sp. 16SWW S1-10-2]|uniref:LytR/AlgR family response regulator transcription factor n=1 Tax=Ancylomarina sp. 16SWW S1-10-2 TaxID=2499681 RepID=UPI0012ADB194|nr:LytTR family DNA-binding domain-containing protein [Ancylomarina sp. 16SWW S1-10-2]MRT93614.1 response regulator transcription factor [Ancylomarina sp. 16SWW S1-10-2]
MQKIKCLLLDDEPIAIRIIERHLENFPEMEVVGRFNSALSAMSFLRENEVDLIFSDIDMPQMNGLQFLKSLTKAPALIFTTAYRNYAVEAFDLDVVDYLMKPISLERMARAINRYHDREDAQAEPIVAKSVAEEVINLKVDKKVVRLALDKIDYFESFGDYAICRYEGGKLVSRETLAHLVNMLPADRFIRIHRQFIVPIAKIESISGNTVYLRDKELPVGRSYRSNLKQKMNL